MGRHEAPDDRSFQRSVLRAVAGAAVALAVTAGIVLLLAHLGGGSQRPLVDAAAPGGPSAGPTTGGPTDRGAPDVSGAPERSDRSQSGRTSRPERGRKAADAKRSKTEGRRDRDARKQREPVEPVEPVGPVPVASPPQQTTVQVLDGVGNRVYAESAAQALRDLGYDVVVLNPAGLDYHTTTVLATAGHEIEAAALRARDARFGRLDRNRTLDRSIDLHVVVGRDWSG